MKKRTKKIIIVSVVVAVLAAGGVIYGTMSAGAAQSQSDTVYGTDTATKGNISLTVSGSGNLESGKTSDVTASSYVSIKEVLVSEGDTVQAGQAIATLDTDAMQTYADDMEQQIESQQTTIDTTNSVTTNLSIKSPADGWVKSVVLDDDDLIEDAMNQYGYVALVATEKREIINADGSGLAAGDKVKVKCQGHTYTGTVTSEKGGLYVSIPTVTRKVGTSATVYDTKGSKLFDGKIELAAYVPVESSYGTITDVKQSENDEVSAGDTIYSAQQYSLSVKEMYTTLDDLKAQYQAVEDMIATGQITSADTGVVDTVNMAAGQSYDEGASLLTLSSTSDWIATVSVDELDINSIQTGQNVSITLDSMPNQEFTGKVARISDKGSASGGITTYDVDVAVDNADGFKIGMSATCEITSQEANDAVLVPVADVITTNSKSYVMVAVDRTDAEKAEIRQMITDKDYTGLQKYMGDDATKLNIMRLTDPTQLLYAEVRAVETGIENAYYIEIKSGLSEGEKVLAQSTSSSSSSNRNFMMGGFGNLTGGEPPRDYSGNSSRNGG